MNAMQQPAAPRTDISDRRPGLWRMVAAVEVALAVVAVLLDLFVPTLVLLGLAAVSLAARRQGLGALGLRRVARPGRMCLHVVAMAVAWTVLTFLLIKPVLEHVLGQREDMSQYAGLQGDLANLLGLLAVSWILAAFGEELAYRGFLLTRLREVLPAGTVGLDPAGIRWLRTVLREFAENGGTVLVSSHVLAEMVQTVDHVVIIARGRFVAERSLDELTSQSVATVRVRTQQPAVLQAAAEAAGFP